MKDDLINTRLSECIQACWECHLVCLSMATGHCLAVGGAHASPDHQRLMHACADICQATADQLILESAYYPHACALCTDVCDSCEASCRKVGDMAECIAACKRCKETCAALSAS